MINKFHKIPDILKLKFIGSVFYGMVELMGTFCWNYFWYWG